MKGDEFDILFLCHEKDKEILKQSMKHAKKNVVGYRKIFLLSKKNFFPEDKEVSFIDEKIFPFNKKDIGKYAPIGRVGWYYQQFLKLYFLNVAGKKALDNVLVIDADLIFLKKTKFFEGNKPLYNIEIGYHQPYYDVLKKVFGFGKQNSRFSGTTHHMMFQRKYINEIIKETKKNKGKEFWKVVMENIDKKTISGFSEQDLYFNYMLKKHPNEIKIRKINFIDFPYYDKKWRKIFRFFGYHYLSAHDYLRKEKFPIAKNLFIGLLTRIRLKRLLKETLIKSKILKVK